MKDLHNLPTKHKEFSAMKKALRDKQKKKNENFNPELKILIQLREIQIIVYK